MGERVQRAPIVGVHDSPGLEVRDYLFDDIADFVDLFVELFFPVQQIPVSGFFDGGEHVVADIPLVAHPVGGLTGEDAGFGEAVGVMTTAVDRVGDPGEIAAEVAPHLHVRPVVLCLPEYNSGCAAQDQQGSKVPSTM